VKKILVSLMVIAVAVGLLAGATAADFSDIEVSQGNTFATGAMDLTVSDYTGTVYNGETVPAFWQVEDAWPCCDKSIFFDLHNEGQGFQVQPWAYLHLKNFECGWVVPKTVYKWINCVDGVCTVVPAPPKPGGGTWNEGDQGTGLPKPVNEPEYVAECGGIAGEDVDGHLVTVPGVGCCYGENCLLPQHIGVILIDVAGPYDTSLPYGPDNPKMSSDVPAADWEHLNITRYDDNGDGVIKLNELDCKQIELGQIPNCNKIWVHIALHLQDIDEDTIFPNGGFFDDTIPAEAKWDHWPTNAIQKDKVKFDMSFELLQVKVPAPTPTPP